MYYYFYKTINLINGRYYLGVHHSSHPETDSYIGSGYILKKAIEKYGRQSFSTTIERYFNSMEEAYAYERQQVTEDVLKDPKCYNLVLGGKGGSCEDIRMNNGIREIKVHRSKEFLMKKAGWMRGNLPRTEETKRKIALGNSKPKTALHKEHLKGPKWRARGKHYIHRGTEITRVYEQDLQQYLSQGWQIGQGRRPWRWVHKGNINKLVRLSEIQQYLDNGWKLGTHKKTRNT